MEKSQPLGIIGGSSLLSSEVFKNFEVKRVSTSRGEVLVYFDSMQNVYFVQRHAAKEKGTYEAPREIDYLSIVLALKECGVSTVISFMSVGSLQKKISVGHIVIPDDYFSPFVMAHSGVKELMHFVPSLDTPARAALVNLFKDHDSFKVVIGGVYANAAGPRFETKAEVRFLATVGDVAGMTGGVELSLLQEYKFNFAGLCVVDNMANGVDSSETMSFELFKERLKNHSQMVDKLVKTVIQAYHKGDFNT